MDIYDCEKELKESFNNSKNVNNTIKYALLETLSPIEDYYEAVNILEEGIHVHDDIRICILGAFLHSYWPQPIANKFLPHLDCYNNITDAQKAIIHYLKAYDIYMRDGNHYKGKVYKDELEQSIAFSSNIAFVYNYYRLAQISNKIVAENLMEIALNNVKEVLDVKQCKLLSIENFCDYDFYVDEHIFGNSLSAPLYESLQEFYSKL